MELVPHQIIGAYRLDAQVGRGGFGTVWRATRVADGVAVAIKFLHSNFDDTAVRRFERESHALKRLKNHHCVALHEFVRRSPSNPAYLVTEFLDGRLLLEWAREPRPLDTTVEVMRQIAAALVAAHAVGVVHRDLKPANVMVSRSGHVTVLDFGLAKMSDDRQHGITATGEVLGTLGFMSPEQLRGLKTIGSATDIYCLGALAYLLLEGRPVFEGDSALEVAMQHLQAPAPSLRASHPERLVALVSRMLSKDPATRPSAEFVVAEFGRLHEPKSHEAPSTATSVKVVIGFVLALLAALGLLAWIALPDPGTPAPPVRGTRPISPAIVKVDEPAISVPDEVVAPPPAEAPVTGSPGCGRAHRGGRTTAGWGGNSVRVLLPPDYDPDREYPLIVALHENSQTPDQFLDELRFEPWVERGEFIVAAPAGDRPLFEDWTDLDETLRQVDSVKRSLCIDLERVYLIGHAGGGYGVEQLICKGGGFAAAAISSHRLKPDEFVCMPSAAVPVLFLAPERDSADPIEGCLVGCRRRVLPLAAHEEKLRQKNYCQDQVAAVEIEGVSCRTWPCEHELVSCTVPGGRHWPGYDQGAEWRRSPNEFDYQSAIWGFFQRHKRSTD